jgi:hypothetical protein
MQHKITLGDKPFARVEQLKYLVAQSKIRRDIQSESIVDRVSVRLHFIGSLPRSRVKSRSGVGCSQIFRDFLRFSNANADS